MIEFSKENKKILVSHLCSHANRSWGEQKSKTIKFKFEKIQKSQKQSIFLVFRRTK